MSSTAATAAERRVLLFPATRRDGETIRSFLDKAAVASEVCSSAAQVVEELEKGAAVLVLTDSGLVDREGARIIASLMDQPAWSDIPVLLLRKSDSKLETDHAVEVMTNVTILERPTSIRSLLSAIRSSVRARERQYEIRDHVAALNEAENSLRQSDQRKDEFLAMLAHELRNPLAPIRAATDLLPRLVPPGDERVDSTLRIVKRQVGQLTRLVDDLLDVSRITQNRIELNFEALDMLSIVAQAQESVEPMVSAKRLSVSVSAASTPLYVSGDRTRLVQCVSNLLTNSAKFTDEGGKVWITVAQEGDWAVLRVEDNGAGFPAELLPRIFDLFVQSAQTLDRTQGGLGIGLSVVRRLVEMHKGEVTGHSPGLGQGATFEIRLPRIAAPHLVGANQPTTANALKRVLIVDDNRDAADSLSLLLQHYGHDVRTAYGAEDALSAAQTYAADVVLLDIGLPTLNGYEVAKKLRAAGTSARLFALTGYGQPDDIRRATAAGFDGHMVKPVDLDRVLEVLAN